MIEKGSSMEEKNQLIKEAEEIIKSQCGQYADNGYCALTLMDTDNRPVTTTITPSKAEGISWMTFCTGFGTRTERINFSPNACVCFNSTTYHIALKGRMEIHTDEATKKEMWYSGLEIHFNGPTDPNYVVLKFIADSYTIFIDYRELRGKIEEIA